MHSLSYTIHNDSPFLPSQKKGERARKLQTFYQINE